MSTLKITSKESQLTKCIGVRHLQFFLLFLSLFFFYGQRTSLSVAIIAMTDKNPPNADIPTYPKWDNTDAVLSSFFWGYILTQTVAGQLGEKFGPKWFLVGTMISGSVANALIPVMAATWGSTGVIICRIVQGLSQGFLYPSIHISVSKWAPFPERSRVISMIYAGQHLGIVIAMIVSGAISGSQLGWPYVFYFYSGAAIIFTIASAFLISDSPGKHKSISDKEKDYIESNTAASTDQKKIPTPWKAILTSLPVWAIFISLSCQSWGTFTLLTEIPSFLSNIMNDDIKSNGLISALPYVVHFLTSFVASPIADKLIATQILSVSVTRKVFNGIGTIVPGLALFGLGFVDSTQKNLAIVLLIMAVGITAFTNSGAVVNLVDLSPNHAGTLLGLTNGTAQIFSIMGPLSVGFLGSDKKDLMLWRKVFWLASGIYIVFGSFYVICSSAKLQPWNDVKDEKITEEKNDGLNENM